MVGNLGYITYVFTHAAAPKKRPRPRCAGKVLEAKQRLADVRPKPGAKLTVMLMASAGGGGKPTQTAGQAALAASRAAKHQKLMVGMCNRL